MKRPLGLLIVLLTAGRLCGAPGARTILVFPFENRSERADLGWISESFAEVLSSRLAAPGNYLLDREERNAAYAQLEIPPETPLTLASEYKVAETLGVDWAVVGTFAVDGQRLTTRAQLLEVRGLKLSPALELTGELPELVDLQTEMAWRLLALHASNFTVGKEEDFRRRFSEVRLDAFENYIRGVLATEDESRIHFFQEADRLNPADHRAAFELGRYYFDQKDYANSAPWLRKLEEKDENYLEALFRLSVDEFFLGQPLAAEKGFEVLAKQLPLNEVWNNLGAMKAHRGNTEEALADFEHAYRGDPTDPDFIFNLGACLWSLKRYDEAAKVLEQGLRLNDEDPDAHSLLAAVLGKLGNSAGQQHELQWLAEHEGSPLTPEDLTGDFSPQTRLKKNYDGRAFRWLSLAVSNALEERLANESPERHSEVHLSRGKNFLAEGRLREAEDELGETTSLLPGDSAGHLTLAQVYEAEGRHVEAARELETSLKLKNSVTAHLWLARVYLSLDHPEAARLQDRAALELDPANREAAQLMDQINTRASARGKKP